MLGSTASRRGRWFTLSALALLVVLALAGREASPAAADIGTSTIAGELIPQGTIVDTSGQPTQAGTDNSCGTSILSGCLVVGSPSSTNVGQLSVTDGFELVSPAPAAWRGLEQTAEATIANLRGVPADRRNQYWARPEINATMFLKLIGLIHQQAKGETPLTAQEQSELDLLSTAYQNFEQKVADRAIALYNQWLANPCAFQVPVGNDPSSYQDSLGLLCASGSQFNTVPAPTAEQFTEWARELVADDFRRSLGPQVQRFADASGAPAMTADEADAEVASEYQAAVGSLEKGFSFMAAAAHVASNEPAATQPEASGELLDTIKEATTDQAQDHFTDTFSDMIEASVQLIGPIRGVMFNIEQLQAEALQGVSDADQIGYDNPIGPYTQDAQELADLIAEAEEQAAFEAELADSFAEALEYGGVILGAAAVIATESIQVAQDTQVLPTLLAIRDAAYATPDLESLTQSSTGWAKLENVFVDELMPDFTLRKLRVPAPDGAAPAPSASDSVFEISGYGQSTASPSILADDWARPGMPQAIHADNGWVTRSPLLAVANDNVPVVGGAPTPGLDILGKAVTEDSFNYIDASGDWWRAWPERGSLMQVRFASNLATVSVYRYLTDGLRTDIPCHDAAFGVPPNNTQPTNNGFRCVVAVAGSHFTTALSAGDYVILGDEVKQVDRVFSDTAFTTTTPFKKHGSSEFEPIDVGSRIRKMVSGDTDCWNDGNCRLSHTIQYESSHDTFNSGVFQATLTNQPLVLSPSMTGTLHSQTLQLGQTCDPQGNCTTPSVSTWTFAPGEQITFNPHAYAPATGDSISTVQWQFCDPSNLCDIQLNDGQPYSQTWSEPGAWTVKIIASDHFGRQTEVDTTLIIKKVGQTIVDSGHAPFASRYGDQFTISPVASSGLPADVSSATTAFCTTSGTHGTTITLVGVGTCRLDVAQAGNDTYNAAPTIHYQFTVLKAVATVNVTPVSVQYSDPLPNLSILGSISGLVSTDSLTGTLSGCTASGLTISSGNVTSPAGSYSLTGCTGLSNPLYFVNYGGSLSVKPEDATITSTTQQSEATATATSATATVALTASVAQASDGHLGDLTKTHLDFLLWSSSNTTTTPSYAVMNVPVNASGLVSTSLALPADAYRLVVMFSDTKYFAGAAATDDIIVFQPTPGVRAYGGGWVTDSTAGGSHKSHFAFNVANSKTGAASGSALFSWLNTADGYTYSATCSNWTGGGLSFSSTTVTISCLGALSAVDSAGLVVPGIAGSGYSVVLKATDGGLGGKNDKFSALVKSPAGSTIHNLSGSGGSQLAVGGGNITMQQK